MVFEGINLCFLGALASASALSRETKEELGVIDVLFLPIGGEDTLTPAEAYKLSLSLEARVIIPMDYEENKDALSKFIKEAGEEPETVDKFTFKKKDIEEKEGAIVVIKTL